MQIELHTWKIVGIRPLMQSNFVATLSSAADPDVLTTSKKKKYDDDEEARVRLYLNAKGQPYHPAMAFAAALYVAASGRKLGKTTARTVLAAAVDLVEDEWLLCDPKTMKPLAADSYVIDKRRVVVNGAGVIRCRPKWLHWGGPLPLDIDREFVGDLGFVTELLNIAGRVAGIGDGRPDTSKGKTGVLGMGKFTAELVK